MTNFRFNDVTRSSSWLLALAAATFLGNACGSSDESRAERGSEGGDDGGGEAGQGPTTPSGGGGKGGTAGTAGTVPDSGGAAGERSETAGAGDNDGAGTSNSGGAAGDAGAGASPGASAGASAEGGAGGADNDCDAPSDCPGDGVGYLCTDHQCVNVAASLSGLLWKLPCTGAIDAVSCNSDPTVTVSTTFGGVSGVTYDVELHFRGVVEAKVYTGGCSDSSYWRSSGADNGDIGNVYELSISAPPQHFFLNSAASGSDHTFAIDYSQTVRVDAGATITLFAASKDAAELHNRDAGGTPISISGTSVAQPFDGQFVQMDVESVSVDPVASNAVIGGGTSGSALQFGGAQLATVADQTLLRPASVTEEAWFQLESASGTYNAILGKPYGAGIDDSYTLWFEAGNLRGYASAGTTASTIVEPWGAAPEWHHAAFSFDAAAGRQTLYIDGFPVACSLVAGALNYDSHPLMIGADNDNGALNGFWNGRIDEARLFSTARSATQIWADLHTHRLGASSGLIGEWTFDESSGQVASDSSGHDLDATLGSSSAVEASDPTWVAGR